MNTKTRLPKYIDLGCVYVCVPGDASPAPRSSELAIWAKLWVQLRDLASVDKVEKMMVETPTLTSGLCMHMCTQEEKQREVERNH